MRDRLGLPVILSLSRRTFSVSSPALSSVKKRMPPKKAPVQEKKVLLGRPSNNLKIGIVGALFIPRQWAHLTSRRTSKCREIILLQCPLPDG